MNDFGIEFDFRGLEVDDLTVESEKVMYLMMVSGWLMSGFGLVLWWKLMLIKVNGFGIGDVWFRGGR